MYFKKVFSCHCIKYTATCNNLAMKPPSKGYNKTLWNNYRKLTELQDHSKVLVLLLVALVLLLVCIVCDGEQCLWQEGRQTVTDCITSNYSKLQSALQDWKHPYPSLKMSASFRNAELMRMGKGYFWKSLGKSTTASHCSPSFPDRNPGTDGNHFTGHKKQGPVFLSLALNKTDT